MKFNCPECQNHIDAGPDWAGQSTDCPHCGAAITVPLEVANEAAPASAETSPPMTRSAPAMMEAPDFPTAPRTSGLAIASLVCGVLGLIVGITFLPAIIMGHIARGQIKRDANLGGGGLALAGLILGYVVVAALILITAVALLASLSVPVYNQINQRAKSTKVMADAKQVVLGLLVYATDHEGLYPESLDQLMPDYIEDPEILQHLRVDGEGKEDFIYFAGFNDSSPANEIVLAAGEVVDGERIVATVDGAVRPIPEDEYQRRTAGRSP